MTENQTTLELLHAAMLRRASIFADLTTIFNGRIMADELRHWAAVLKGLISGEQPKEAWSNPVEARVERIAQIIDPEAFGLPSWEPSDGSDYLTDRDEARDKAKAILDKADNQHDQ